MLFFERFRNDFSQNYESDDRYIHLIRLFRSNFGEVSNIKFISVIGRFGN
jgi:hypothetical protein